MFFGWIKPAFPPFGGKLSQYVNYILNISQSRRKLHFFAYICMPSD